MSEKVSNWIPDNSGPASLGVIGILVSVLLHAGIVGAAVMLGSFSFTPTVEGPEMMISIADAQLPMSDLPPLGDSQDAGPVNAANTGETEARASEEVADQAIINEPDLEQQQPVEEEKPVVEDQKIEEQIEKPVEKPKPKPIEKKPEPKVEKKIENPVEKVVSSNPVRKDPVETQPDPEPTAREVAQELQQKRGTRSRSFRGSGGNSATGLIASGNDGGGVSSGPALYNSNLTQIISMNWQPPAYRPGEVRDATVEFTIYSPPLERNAVNTVRVARVMNIRIVKSSGEEMYDQRALEAVRRIRSWPPPPDSYKKETLVVTCRFYLVGDE